MENEETKIETYILSQIKLGFKLFKQNSKVELKTLFNRQTKFLLFVCLIPLIISFSFLDKLPGQISIYVNRALKYINKYIFIFAFPIFMAFIETIFIYIINYPSINKNAPKKAINIFLWLIPIFTLFVNSYVLINCVGIKDFLDKSIFVFIGLAILLFGYFFNYSYESFNKKHKTKLTQIQYLKYLKIFKYFCSFVGVIVICLVFIL